ncbi:thioredoxin family protein, partial [Neisseria meningitidis 2000063]
MKSKHLALGVAALFALAACDSKVQTSVPADSAPAASAAAAPAGLVEGQNYTVLANPIPQQQAGKVEVLEFFGYFCPHCAHLEPVLSKHAKSFKDDMYLRTEHVVWQKEMLTLARLAAAVDM